MSIKPRIKVTDSAKVGDVIEVKTLVSHVMETGNRKDAQGNVIPRKILNAFSAKFDGKEIFKAELGSGISANPYLSFHMRVPGPGELEFIWVEDGGATITEKMPLKIG